MKFRQSSRKNRKSRGQVLLLGIAVMIVLLIAALLLFDLHSGIRAKIKVETAQQAAALAGAQWQVAGLNMLGELNLAKACTLMLDEDSVIAATPFNRRNTGNLTEEELEKAKKRHRLESRLRTLNEAQSRVSFILPLLGYAAVQQTAKQNGMSDAEPGLRYYFTKTLPLNDHKNRAIQGYFWYEPYRQLVEEILDQRTVLRCNARVSEMPEVWSNSKGSRKIRGGGESNFALLLSEESLYDAIANGNYCHWQLMKIAKQGIYLDSPWWKITYIPGEFVEESELLPLGVRYGDGANVPDLLQQGLLDRFSGPTGWNTDPELQPDSWCLYDRKWYGSSWHAEAYESQQANWRGGRWLRGDRLAGFLYEGAVTAVDGAVETSRIMTFHASAQPTSKDGGDFSGKLTVNAPLQADKSTQVTVGRTSTQRGINLGVVAKVLGGFNDLRSADDAPTVTPLILPVFSRGLLIPSSMPYSVSMLTNGDDALKRFLKWLSTWPDIENSAPPDGTEWYLEQLKKLMDPDFILGIYNPDFPGLETLDLMDLMGEDYVFPDREDGAGWLQRAFLGRTKVCPKRIRYTGRILKCGDCDLCKHQSAWVKGASKDSCGSWETKQEPAVPDDVPVELPQTYVDEKGFTQRYYTDFAGVTRIYYGNQKTGYRYCIKRNGKIQDNEDVVCNGHLYVPGGGDFLWGIESGPPRL